MVPFMYVNCSSIKLTLQRAEGDCEVPGPAGRVLILPSMCPLPSACPHTRYLKGKPNLSPPQRCLSSPHSTLSPDRNHRARREGATHQVPLRGAVPYPTDPGSLGALPPGPQGEQKVGGPLSLPKPTLLCPVGLRPGAPGVPSTGASERPVSLAAKKHS